MKLFLFLIGVITVLSIDARSVDDAPAEPSSDLDEDNSFLKHIRERATSQMRHKRRSRQSQYFDYWNQNPYDSGRRDYDRNQDELLYKILNKLDEISLHMRTQQQAPPPIYVPYPLPYPVPRYTTCLCRNPSRTNVTFPDRWPEMEDTRQNWGLVVDPPEIHSEIEGDGSRPIYIRPKEPSRPVTTEPPKVEIPDDEPGPCQAAILSCCASKQQQNCFVRYGCLQTYKTGIACKPEVIKSVIAEFSEKYGPQ